MNLEDLTTYKIDNNENFARTAINATYRNNKLSNLFFSQLNIDALQLGLKNMVYKKSGNVINNQDETQLKIIMRSIFLQYSRNLEDNIVEQVRELNQKVLDYSVPKIIIELENYKFYLNDIAKLPVPLERSKNMSSSGTKFLYTSEL